MDGPGIYGSLSDYFGTSGGSSGANRSPGKAGGAGYKSDISTGYGSSGDSTGINPSASAGAGGFAFGFGLSSSDKSSFSTTFNQSFGGITNNQIVDSPNSTGASQYAPAGASPTAGIVTMPAGQGSVLLVVLAIIVAAVIVKVKG